jgi:acetate kinase
LHKQFVIILDLIDKVILMAGVGNWQTEARKKLMNIIKEVAINVTEYPKSRIKQFTLQ